jgi:hypothetical protein
MDIKKRKISPRRWTAFIVGGISVILFSLQVGAQLLLGLIAGISMFLGVTDFGRQCPLLISVHQILSRIRKQE